MLIAYSDPFWYLFASTMDEEELFSIIADICGSG